MPRTPRSRTPIYCTPLTRSKAARTPLSRRRTALLNLGLATGIAAAVTVVGASAGSSATPAEPAAPLSLSSNANDLSSFNRSLDTQIGLASRQAAALRTAAAHRHAADIATARAKRARQLAADRRASRSRRAALLAGNPRDIARAMLADRGQSGEFGCLDNLWTRESGWQVHDTNGSSGAYGIPQSLPADKMASAGADYRDNPATQIRWGLGYITDRYGSPCAAWSHSQSYNWY